MILWKLPPSAAVCMPFFASTDSPGVNLVAKKVDLASFANNSDFIAPGSALFSSQKTGQVLKP